jgi:Rho-type GTPase-activating protein 1/2
MFGRDLTEQVRADSKYEERQVPVIVEKCIEAVEARGELPLVAARKVHAYPFEALEYEGIYRKTGGSSQSKAITQMFERGDYASFDLCDADKFNDICSITSVLKTYFRSLPVPLLTFDLHDQFMAAVAIRDPSFKNKSLTDLVNRLPDEHYFTLRMLMLHLKQ